jgi:hypothetical protein
LVSKQLVHAQTLMARELCAIMPRLRKLVSLPQPEWILSPQTDIPNYARVHLFNLNGDDFKDAAYLDVLHLDCHILHDRDKLERHFLEENELFQNENWYLFRKCQWLELVSIMYLGKTYLDNEDDRDLFGDDMDNEEEWIT